MKFPILLAIAILGSTMAQAQISVSVNGQPLQFSGAMPQMVGGRVLVPLRGIFESLNANVQWTPSNQTINATRGQDSVQLQIGNPNATVNGRPVTLDVPAQLIGGSTMVPIRFVSEAMGADVHWNQAAQIVAINSGQDNPGAGQNMPAVQEDEDGPSQSANAGPVRMARISLIQGDVTWRPSEDSEWLDAGPNLPLRQGAEIWLTPGSRAEVQFDDGSLLRLGNGAIATLQTMYSDDQGEFTEVRLNTGTGSLRLKNRISVYQLDTPLASVKAGGPASLRVDDSNGFQVSVRQGRAMVQGQGGSINVETGSFLELVNASSSYAISPAPGEDEWDRFCDSRDGIWQHPSPYLPSNIALVAGDLDSYGSWVNDPQYGYCWHPREQNAGWAPYQNGKWVWVNPFGWTWCGNEPWGWAPYHYGTWFSTPGGWAWRPGPAQQYWTPAVVHFSTYNGSIAWCPLAPAEVRYPPAISVGLRAGNWSLNFSIGGAAAYYPASPAVCAPRPWSNVNVNRTTIVNVTNITTVNNVYVTNRFIPSNSRVVGAATVASTDRFGTGGNFVRGSSEGAAIFSKGQAFAPPANGTPRFAGPTSVAPTAASFSPTHSFSQNRPSPTLLNRTVVQAPLPKRLVSEAPPLPKAIVLPRAAPSPRPVTDPFGGRPHSHPMIPAGSPTTVPVRTPIVNEGVSSPVQVHPTTTRPVTTRPMFKKPSGPRTLRKRPSTTTPAAVSNRHSKKPARKGKSRDKDKGQPTP